MAALSKNPSLPPESPGARPAYRRIADGLRDQIVRGELAPGAQLPSEGRLVVSWQASSFTIHTALQTLIKEGWIESVRGRGVYVSKASNRFLCAGIYYGVDICSDEQTSFLRRVHVALLRQFRRLGKETLVFMDTRPESEQAALFPVLARAIANRQIQCLVFPSSNQFNLKPLLEVPLPNATISGELRNGVTFDEESLFRGAVHHLKAGGCRSIGFVTSIPPDHAAGMLTHRLFRRTIREAGLVTHRSWIREPGLSGDLNLEVHGYREFKALWALRRKPEGVIVFPDGVARGVTTAILETGFERVKEQMKFVFHTNLHLPFLCPLPVTWAISDEDKMAGSLIRLVQAQFRGKNPSRIVIPHTFRKEQAPQLQLYRTK